MHTLRGWRHARHVYMQIMQHFLHSGRGIEPNAVKTDPNQLNKIMAVLVVGQTTDKY